MGAGRTQPAMHSQSSIGAPATPLSGWPAPDFKRLCCRCLIYQAGHQPKNYGLSYRPWDRLPPGTASSLAEETTRYETLEGALACLIEDFRLSGIRANPDHPSLFNGNQS